MSHCEGWRASGWRAWSWAPSDDVEAGRAEWFQEVVAIGAEAFDFEQGFEPAPGAAPREKDDDIDGFDDQRAWYGDDGFLDELLQAREARFGRISVHGGDAAGVAGIPSLQHVQGFASAHLTDDDAVGSQAQGGAHEIAEADSAGLGAQRQAIGGRTLEFAGVLEDDHALAEVGDFGQERVDQGGLAAGGAADHQDVLAVAHGERQDGGLTRGHDTGDDIVAQAI